MALDEDIYKKVNNFDGALDNLKQITGKKNPYDGRNSCLCLRNSAGILRKPGFEE